VTTDDTRPQDEPTDIAVARFIARSEPNSTTARLIATLDAERARHAATLKSLEQLTARHAALVAAAQAVIDAKPYWGDLPAALEALEAAIASEEADRA
jgi:hypothetical protein